MAKLNSGTRIYGTANVDTQINIGTNVVANTTGIFPASNTVGTQLGNTISRWVVNANTGNFSGAVSGITTLATGNTTITGFANISTSVNSALLTVGTSFIANTTGAYHTGLVNAASITIGSSSFTANLTAIVIANPLTANGTTGTSGQVLTSNGTSGAPYWAASGGESIRTVAYYTGDGSTTNYGINYDIGYLDVYVNGVKYKFGSDYTASNGTGVSILSTPLDGDNIELVAYHNDAVLLDAVLKAGDTMTGTLNVPVLNSSGSVNAASHTIGSILIANTTGVYHTGTINAASHTIGSTLIANTTGVYHTGTINAASITIGSSSFIANSTAVLIADPLTANGTTGIAGQVLASNGTTGSPYWVTSGSGATASDDTSTNGTRYVLFANQTSGSIANAYVSSTRLLYNPSSGTLTSTVVTSSSDQKLKTNIETIVDPLEVVGSIRGVSFDRIDTGVKDYGVIAQEIEKIIPEVVHVDSEGFRSVSYNSIIGFLIEGMKKQQHQINQLQDNINKILKDNNIK